MSKLEIAVTVGSSPCSSVEYILTGRVVVLPPAMKMLMVVSSKETINENMPATMSPGLIIGKVIFLNVSRGPAPKSLAAYSIFISYPTRLESTVRITYTIVISKWATKMALNELVHPNIFINCIKAIPIMTAGTISGERNIVFNNSGNRYV
jgi:hypothetical protein